MRNTVALGASCALFDIPVDHMKEIVRDTFGHKGDSVVKLNADVFMAGYSAVSEKQRKAFPWSIRSVKNSSRRILLTGNDALALGAIQAGCQLFSAYPMTPATSILHTLAQNAPAYGIVVRHAEDEIGAIHHAIGGAYAGVRAMTATSGGGFALMTEGVGLAAMAEVGIVVVDAQRPGPSTGLPTWTEQGDLRQVLHASQGDFPRIVLAPSSHAECFTMIQEAFNLADAYQTPVIVLTDKYLAEAYATVDLADLKALPISRGKMLSPLAAKKTKAYLRYRADIADGSAPRSLPGTPNGLFLANSDEHDEFGYSNEEADNRIAQVERRARKIATLRKSALSPRRVGPAKAPLTVVTWGSSAGPVEAALDILKREYRLTANALIVGMIAPLPIPKLLAALKSSRRTVMVEANRSGKLAGYIREQTGFTIEKLIKRYDGRPFDPVELAAQFAALIKRS
jgi:2-oxoglutarate ferredoxin oxidoreductase subunit alpha